MKEQTQFLKPGWLKRQMKQVREDIALWPSWMRRAAGIAEDGISPSGHKKENSIACRRGKFLAFFVSCMI